MPNLSEFRSGVPVAVGGLYPIQAGSNLPQVTWTTQELTDALRPRTAFVNGMHIATTGYHIADASIFDIWDRYTQPAPSSLGNWDFAKSLFNPSTSTFAGTGVSNPGNGVCTQASDGIAGNNSGLWLVVQARTGTFHLARSTNNGATWAGVSVTGAASGEATFVKLVNSLFWTFVGTTLYSSADGVTWNARHTLASVLTSIVDVVHNGSRYVAVGAASGGAEFRYLTSADGVTWSEFSHSIPNNTSVWSIDYDSTVGRFVAVGYVYDSPNTGRVVYSSNGTTWTTGALFSDMTSGTAKLRACGGRYYISIAASGGLVSYASQSSSTDGITWSAFSGPTSGCYGFAKSGTTLLGVIFNPGSIAYRPFLVGLAGGSTLPTLLGDWLGLSISSGSSTVPNVLPGTAPNGSILAIAAGVAGSREVYFTTDLTPKSMRVPALTRVD